MAARPRRPIRPLSNPPGNRVQSIGAVAAESCAPRQQPAELYPGPLLVVAAAAAAEEALSLLWLAQAPRAPVSSPAIVRRHATPSKAAASCEAAACSCASGEERSTPWRAALLVFKDPPAGAVSCVRS